MDVINAQGTTDSDGSGSERDHLDGHTGDGIEASAQAYLSGGDNVETYKGQHHRVPELMHRFRHDQSILCIAVTSSYIFAGTQSGDILVRTHLGLSSHRFPVGQYHS